MDSYPASEPLQYVYALSIALMSCRPPRIARTQGKYFADEFAEIEDILEERLKMAEDTSRALRIAYVRDYSWAAPSLQNFKSL